MPLFCGFETMISINRIGAVKRWMTGSGRACPTRGTAVMDAIHRWIGGHFRNMSPRAMPQIQM